MKKLINKADKVEELIQVHFDPVKLSKAVEEMIYDNLEIEVTVHHDFDEVEIYHNYFLVIDTLTLEDEDISKIEKFFGESIFNIYEMTLSIIDNLFESLASTSYVKLIDSIVYVDSSIVVEFTPENYQSFLKI